MYSVGQKFRFIEVGGGLITILSVSPKPDSTNTYVYFCEVQWTKNCLLYVAYTERQIANNFELENDGELINV